MFCLRSWLPLLFIPTNASPLFILSFVVLTYILHRPCIYCSALLLILFTSSCQWSDRCFVDLRGDWFAPRFSPSSYISGNGSTIHNGGNATMSTAFEGVGFGNDSFASFVRDSLNSTATAVAGAAIEEIKKRTSIILANGTAAVAGRQQQQEEWTGIGLEWLRSLLGRREWTIPCIDVKVQL